MNKNLKKIVAIALAIGTISAVAPATNINFLTTKAYASSDDDTNDETELDSLQLLTESGSKIKLYTDSSYDSDDKVDADDVEAGEKYFAKTSSDTISIDIDGPSSKYVRVFKGTSDSTKGKKISSDISLDGDSTTTLTVRVYDEEPDDDVRLEDDDYSSEYTIKVKCTADSSDSDDEDSDDSSDDYDDIYLDRLSVDGQTISLSKSKVEYTYNVSSDTDEVTIKATPDEDDYDVTIDGDSVDEDDKYKSDVDLDKGENKIKIELEDGDDERVYTLIINRGGTSSTTGSTSNTASGSPSDATDVVATVTNKWVQVGGNWQYKDATGNTVKNTWVQNYFVQADGNMATGWLNYSGKWYYLGSDGARKTGWQQAGGKWYYLDSEGAMQTGWVRDLGSGKYYYLNSDGSMAYNTMIGKYKLGSDGAWIN
ncbi:N-acetylmuramoyl-L-alanine amidase family protein [Clostridium beijerinckii]|uniref:N-acetylmuramoyl-L-alanine amidase family protein n=1 Tax=Clostridium beijerinckii TaxID=1520 RepID=UPI0013612885|nr:cadherin-like beta sandwich domain-containing protein [Clostridium beijerinckii]MZK53450.1 cell wall-binding protein [Clostridium beijerinckii]MZK61588.1 cell wall-binding protein [Clostridium beijerinckii]MZK71874.1 cell wall-binding protein [Clostridium beijerinckii]MZK77217.1 cell wall-binding protein [Clostridium beijerinckii]MZK86845.1 cell wall-binding protein [Clostridium beijerinckii]